MGDVGFVWRDKEYVTSPRNNDLVRVVRDSWWAVNSEGQILFYLGYRAGEVGAPQMNSDPRIVDRIRYEGVAGMEQIPLAFIPIRIGDYT